VKANNQRRGKLPLDSPDWLPLADALCGGAPRARPGRFGIIRTILGIASPAGISAWVVEK